MSETEISIERLRDMIGVQVHHEGVRCEVVEILEDGPTLILTSIGEDTIQSDQFGSPSRRVPQTYLVPVLAADGSGVHPAFLALDVIAS